MQLATKFGRHSSAIRRDRPLTEDEMRAAAPSIFAPGKHDSRSERYTYIPTIEIVRGMQKEGFEPFMVGQGRSHVEGKAPFTKHIVRFRRPDDITKSDGAPEIVQINAHDGTAAHQLLAGYIKWLCMNSMVVGEQFADVRVQHKGDIVGQVIQGAYTILDETVRVTDSRDAMRAVQLAAPEQSAFARAALRLRYEEHSPIEPAQLLTPRRFEDRPGDLWSVFNRVQENMIQGGLEGRTVGNRATRTRAINGIDQNTALNRGLWTLAEEMRRLKSMN
jgi:hypothetical protein